MRREQVERIEQLADAAVAAGGVPGIVVQIHDADTDSFFASGWGDLRTRTPRTRADRFRIGSLTKTFTAVLVMQLVAEDELKLDDPVGRWLPGLVRGGGHDEAHITVADLLQQTSGVFNYSLDPAMLADFFCPRFLTTRFDRYSPDQLVEKAMTHPPAFRAGQRWQYSNTNYVLAGMIIEAVSGRSYADNITERISTPLGLAATCAPQTDTLESPHCRHYSRDASGVVHDVTDQNPSTTWAAGGMVSTVTELQTFFTAALSDTLLPCALTNRMFATVPTDDSGWIPHTRYGLGIFTQTLPSGASVWGGGGAVNGSWTYCMGDRNGERVVTLHINGDWADDRWTHPVDVFTDLLDIAFHDS